MARYARVLVDMSLDRAFDYRIPPALEKAVRVGTHVVVPFQRREVNGCVVELPAAPDLPPEKLKDVIRLHSERPSVPEALIGLGEWMAKYYCCAREQATRALLPGVVREGKIKAKTETFISIADPAKAEAYLFEKKRSAARQEVLRFLTLRHDVPMKVLMTETGAGTAAINAMVKEGILLKRKRRVERDPFETAENAEALEMEKELTLTDEQRAALNDIEDMLTKRSSHFVCLLHGVTCSGKTEVYLRAIQACLDQGKEAIALVPEIALTPQTTRRFRSRFGDFVSVLHSGLTPGERFDEWSKVYEGRVKIAVGARSALFAPFRNLGLIVVDEEHESSYKQDDAPRYHARDAAVMRAYREKAVIILGSATPSLESYYNALNGKYHLVSLTRRFADQAMPAVRVVDMREEAAARGGAQIFSKTLLDAIYDRVILGEQVILFLNRRGFATHLSCVHCGYVAACSECSIDFIYHRSRESLSCHLCGAVLPAPSSCPNCGAPDIRYGGVGTEKVETVAAALFPGATVARADSDTMTNAKAYEDLFRKFRQGKIDILIGTQMIAKGLDFPKVTLVGIINADVTLRVPDFRAEERTFQLLTQVAGRAGRGHVPGEVIIQTYTPFNPAIRLAVEHDYQAFYREEIVVREQLLYPPAGRLIALRFSGENEEQTRTVAQTFADALTPFANDKLLLSPAVPAPIEKIKGRFRYALVLRGKITDKLRETISNLIFRGKFPKDVKVHADVDAVNLM